MNSNCDRTRSIIVSKSDKNLDFKSVVPPSNPWFNAPLLFRQHFVDDPDHYSLQDLIDVKSGELTEFLERTLENFEEHIRGCVLCAAKGFFCELCDNKKVIFPFDDAASRCPDCRGVFHRGCFAQSEAGSGSGNGQCPRCERRRKKAEGQRSSSALVSVEDEEVVEATVYDEALARGSSRRSSRE